MSFPCPNFHILFPTADTFISGVKQQGLPWEIVYLLAELKVRMFSLLGCFVLLIPCQRGVCGEWGTVHLPVRGLINILGSEMVWGKLFSTVSLFVNSNNT